MLEVPESPKYRPVQIPGMNFSRFQPQAKLRYLSRDDADHLLRLYEAAFRENGQASGLN